MFQIERIENYYLYEHYQVAKSHVSGFCGSGVEAERQLWHGTAKDALNNIYAGGFNRSYCGKNGKEIVLLRDKEIKLACKTSINLFVILLHGLQKIIIIWGTKRDGCKTAIEH